MKRVAALGHSVGRKVSIPLIHCSARGGCDCDCSWANPAACGADDKTCCHACCCKVPTPAPSPSQAPKKQLTLAEAIRIGVEPVLKGLSDNHNQTAWSFSYRDADIRVSFCVGYTDLASRTPCSAGDLYAWGSATKTHTALLIVQLAEKGLFKLADTLVSLANDYLRAISNGTSDLIQLFGPEVKAVTVRQLLQMTAGLTEYDTANTRAYQNSHRQDDLTPMWVLNVANHTFRCKPGTCGVYSSTNYVLLGLVAARFQHASSWDTLDQRAWMQRIPTDLPEVQPGGSFKALYYGMHGPYSAFKTAVAADGTHATVHGYQLPLDGTNCSTFLGCPALDVYTMSASGGWTCGNLVSTSTSVADFYWALLGPERKKVCAAQ